MNNTPTAIKPASSKASSSKIDGKKLSPMEQPMRDNDTDYIDRIRALSLKKRRVLAEQLAPAINRSSSQRNKPVSGLTAYVVAQNGSTVDTREMAASLSKKLPEYMIPREIIQIDALPLTPSGKVDLRALPNLGSKRGTENKAKVDPRTALEKEIAGMWSDVLGLQQISMEDNFFELGGDSLLAVKLFAMIKNRVGQDLPLALLFETPRLGDLVAKINMKNQPLNPTSVNRTQPASKLEETAPSVRTMSPPIEHASWNALVPIRPEGDRLPLFLMHGIGGNVLNYSALLPFMDKSQPVYGLQARGLDGLTEPFHDVDEMAAHYVAEIQKVHPQGPYLLGGGSMGGAMALQMAQRLHQIGEHVLFLGMFDTISPFAQYQKRGIEEKTKALMQSDQKVKTALNYLSKRAVKALKKYSFSAICNLYRKIKKPIPQLFRYWYITQTNYSLMNRFTPKPYNGRITLFRSTFATDKGPDRGWGKIPSEGLDIIQIPARHKNFIESPELGKRLASFLDHLQEEYRRSPAKRPI